MSTEMKVTALAPWFGSNRMLGAEVGKALAGCSWVGVPFAGGMSELAHIKCSTLAVNDLHRHIINLACVLACQRAAASLAKYLDALPLPPKRAKGRAEVLSGNGSLEF